MEFPKFQEFFESLLYAKRKYPMIMTYVKYLASVKEYEDKLKEVDLFRVFLLKNPERNTLASPDFKTGKSSLTLNMQNFVAGEGFWERLYTLEDHLFAFGKPTLEEYEAKNKSAVQPQASSATQAALNILRNNPVFSKVVSHIESSSQSISDVSGIGDVLNNPAFKHVLDDLKSGLSSGKYSPRDLTSTLTDIISVVQDDLDPDARQALSTVSGAMKSMENGQGLDMGGLMNAVTSIKLQK
jgi:hypothetical protein